MPPLKDVATIVRSKNAGAFVLTIDIMFPDEETLMAANTSETLTTESLAEIFAADPKQVTRELAPKARAIKVSLPRETPSGHFGDRDIYGALQYVRLLDLEINTV